jgi:hypothetical protein
LRKADLWYASISLQCEVSIPDSLPHGHPIGVDIGLEKFLATSDGVFVKPPKFFKQLQSQHSTELTPKSEIAATQIGEITTKVEELRKATYQSCTTSPQNRQH